MRCERIGFTAERCKKFWSASRVATLSPLSTALARFLLETLHWLLKPSCEVVALLADSSAVLESMMRLKPDVVVLDDSMPDVHGFDLCRQIKRITPETRTVFLTAFGDEDLRNLAFSVGAVASVTN